MSFSRRDFVRVVPTLGAFTVSADIARAQEREGYAWPGPPSPDVARDEAFPSQHPSLAREIVGVAHANLARVKELVTRHPALAKASWDWGYGDWETALGSASHTGNRAIAEFLIENGAPPTIFSAAMLGQLDVVKAFAAAIPNAHQLRGPHSIPLANHARAGGPQAAAVLAFIESLGPMPQFGDLEPLTDAERSSIQGRYVFGDRPRDAFIVDVAQNRLGITRVGGERRVIFHIGRLAFHPAGAPAVRIRFEKNAAGMVVSVLDPDLVVRATRT